MTTKQYLRDDLAVLADKFPSVTIKYGFDDTINTHVVELTPREEYYTNTHLDKAWIPVSLKFMQRFPNDYISFISDDSPLKVEQPVFTFNENHTEFADCVSANASPACSVS